MKKIDENVRLESAAKKKGDVLRPCWQVCGAKAALAAFLLPIGNIARGGL